MNASSWEQLMDIIDINGDGIVSLEELERYPTLTLSHYTLDTVTHTKSRSYNWKYYPLQSLNMSPLIE
jgi:hypothetical protein